MTEQPTAPRSAAPGWAVLLFLVGFLGWGYVYLFMLRPVMNAWLAQYISGYPAMLHLVPILGVPILVGMLVGWLMKLLNPETTAK